MALTVGVLKVSLRADANPLFQGLAGALRAVESFAKKSREMASQVAGSAGALTAMVGAASALAATVDGRTAVAVERLRKDTAHFAVQVADVLSPAMKEMGATFRRLADFVAGLSPELKRSIGHFSEMAVGVAFAAKGYAMLMGVLGPVASALATVATALSGIGFGAVALGAMQVVLVLGAIVAAVTLVHKAWRENWGGIQEKTGAVLATIRRWFSEFFSFIATGYQFLLDGFLGWLEVMVKGLAQMSKEKGWNFDLTGSLEGIEKLKQSSRSLSDVWEAVSSAVEGAAGAVKDEFAPIVDGLMAKLKKLKDQFQGGGQARVEVEFQNIFTDFKASAADAFVYAIKEGGKELQKLAGNLWDTFQRNPLAMGRQQRQAAYADAKKAEKQANVGVGESSWDLAMKALEAASRDGATFADSLGLWTRRMSDILAGGLTQALGAMGELVNAAMQGAKAGGVWGAIVAVFMDLLNKTESVKRFASAALDAVGQIVAALEPVVAPIMDALINVLKPIVEIFRVVFDALGPFFRMIGSLINSLVPILKMIGTIMKYLAPILQVIFVAIGTVVAIIMSIILPIVAAIQEIGGNHEGAAQTMRSLDELWTAVGTPMVNSANGAATALDGTAAAAQAVTESLMNVPEGYKVNQARFQAAIAEGDYTMPGSSTPGMPGPSGPSVYTPPPITFNGDLVVQAQDPEDLLAQLHARVVRINGQRYGTPVGAP